MRIPFVPVAGFPVTLHVSALVVLGLLVYLGTQSGAAFAMGLYGIALFGSVLVHEVGHAVVARNYGLEPITIELHGFGGFCRMRQGPDPDQAIAVALAGPAAGVGLGLMSAAAWFALHNLGIIGWRGDVLMEGMVKINVFWSLFNLLPMFPLDGGVVMQNWFQKRSGYVDAKCRTRRISLGLSVVLCAVGIAMAWESVALISGFVLLQNLWQKA